MTYDIHISDVRMFKSCRRRWAWQSPILGNWEPELSPLPFVMGRGIHLAMEQFYRSGVPFLDTLDDFFEKEADVNGTLWASEIESLGEAQAMSEGMLRHYDLWRQQRSVSNAYADNSLEFIELEKSFRVPLTPDADLTGRFDGIVHHKPTDTYWIWEIKTAAQIAPLRRSLANDEQATAYVWAANHFFPFHVNGLIYNILRKKVPPAAKVLKTGVLSQAARADTTFEWFSQEIAANHPDWREDTIQEFYGNYLQELKQEGNAYFARFSCLRTPEELDVFSGHLMATVEDMIAVSGAQEALLYPSPSTMNCGYCAFWDPCLAVNHKNDPGVFFNARFTQRTDHLERLDPQGDSEIGA